MTPSTPPVEENRICRRYRRLQEHTSDGRTERTRTGDAEFHGIRRHASRLLAVFASSARRGRCDWNWSIMPGREELSSGWKGLANVVTKLATEVEVTLSRAASTPHR